MAEPINYIRRLTIALMISGALNIAMIALYFYGTMYERPPTPYYELKPAGRQELQSPLAIDHSNSEVIRYFKRMPREWLVGRLSNSQLVENGYTQRDLSLAVLLDAHHFDLDRALIGLPAPTQRRTIVYGKYKDGRSAELVVYPGLSDQHYEAIAAFATRERWPLTNQGLFAALKKDKEPPKSLLESFYMTPEFQSVELLFGRGNITLDKAKLLNLLLEGDWNTLYTFAEGQKAAQDLTPARRQRFLLDYIERKSKTAAYVMLEIDGDFAVRKLDDTHTAQLLELLEDKTPEAEKFAKTLLTSPRSDHVWKLAATRLYEYTGESMPEGKWREGAISKLKAEPSALDVGKPAVKQVATSAPPITPPPQRVVEKPKAPANKQAPVMAISKPVKPVRQHVVAEGDTLWKIATKYKVDVQQLKSLNKMDSDNLKPGRTLKIP